MQRKLKFVYFVSDAHLGADSDSIEKVKEKNLLSFLALVKETGKSLYIVGDLFDFWFEYRHAIPSQHHRILAKFSQLVEQGIEVDYVAGNHDYWFRDFLSGQVGIRVHQKPVETHLGNSKFFISHGDGIIKNDPGYRILKKILQNPVSICLYQMLHPDWGIPLARFASNRSRKHPTPQHDSDYLEFAKSKLDQGFDFVILGHSHRPLIYQYQNGKAFINIGDWIENFTYGKYDGKNLTLQRWKNYQSQKDFCAHKITGNFCAV